MKKLLSLILALVTLLSVATVMSGAAETDVAQTSATYYVSTQPYENVANATIIGYLGDVDSSTDVTILDATEIQLSIARLTTFSDKQKNLGDVDRDGNVSILDATSIQCFIASIPTDTKVAHTLYTKNSTPESDVFTQVINYIKANGKYDERSQWYRIYTFSDTLDTSLIYSAAENKIIVSADVYSGDTMVSVFLTAPVVKSEFEFNTYLADKYIGEEQIYDAFGKAKQVKSTDKKLLLENVFFNTEKNITFESVEAEIQNAITKGFADIEKKSNGKITNLYQIFG